MQTRTGRVGVFHSILCSLVCISLVVSLFACSGGGGSGSSSSGKSGTGGIAFSLNWKGSAANNTESSFDICATGVATITANVYNSSNALVASGSWPCAAHTGTINSVPAGSNYSVIGEALDSSNSITWAGQLPNINVNPGAVTYVTLTMLNSPNLTSIAITPINPSITLGSNQQFTATGTYTDTSTTPATISTLDITLMASWTSSNTGIATINVAGLATSIAVGSSNITATFAGISNYTTLTVNPIPSSGYSVSGQVTLNGSGLSGVTVTVSGVGSVSTDTNGNYSFSGVVNGSYTITPSKAGYSFTPSNISIVINNANATGQNFTADGIWDSSKWDNAPWGP